MSVADCSFPSIIFAILVKLLPVKCDDRSFRMKINLKNHHGPFDIIGDVHGCFIELKILLEKLGYKINDYDVTPPTGRTAVFLGDLVDRGPMIVDVLRLVMGMVNEKKALCIMGNHDNKLYRKLEGRKVMVAHGLEESVEQLKDQPKEFIDKVRRFLGSLPTHYILDDGKLVVAHAGIRKDMIGKVSKEVEGFTLYGEVNGKKDENGLPLRIDWASKYDGDAIIVYGHTPKANVYLKNNTINIDTGCVFGRKLTALKYPEMTFEEVDALGKYYDTPRPIV